MKTLLKLPITLLSLSLPFAVSAADMEKQSPWLDTFNGINKELISPNYLDFSQSAAKLSRSIEAFCQQPNAEKLSHTQTAFADNLQDWQQVQWLNFGPVTLFMRYYSFEYWPDKKGLTQRQLTSLIKNDVDTSDEKFWRSASIAVRGLTAIESLLYRSQFDPMNKPEYCQLLVQVGQHHEQSTDRIYQEWQTGQLADWTFFDEDEVGDIVSLSLEKMIQQWLEHMSMVKESKIETPIGWRGKANLKLAEFYRSEQSLNAIKQNITLYNALYHAGENSLYQKALATEPKLAKQLDESFKQALVEASKLPDDFYSDSLAKNTRVELAKPVVSALSKAQNELLSLVTKLGFQIGFNSRDGD
ncbi:peptidase M75, Imelysin [Marinomonas sp. SBI22]|uniref:imelysin family protein n=1 Tax=unclassified Marinomonas TaxID=196814 RepID=UPI0007AFA0B0|nr:MULTISPECIES: imelysin family protein [unclassified Marinomonas]KZM39118.1 peptidase M75, Imelysin [Marinomonas sp. SBI22]KZM39902.1 peptidase M75, Imelysin [Marinomonas sp. SBI8L]